MRIVVIDDYADVRVTLEAALDVLGFDSCGTSSSLAIEVAGTFKPDLILIDLTPQTADLLMVLRVLLGPLVVIGMTNDVERLADHQALGLSGALLKPFVLEDLRAMLRVHAPAGGFLS